MNFQIRWAQTTFGLSHSLATEVWEGVEFDGLWGLAANAGCRPTDMVGLEVFGRIGAGPAFDALVKGDETQILAAAELKPVDRLIIEPTFDYLRSEDSATGELLFRQAIARARVRLQIDPRLSLRLVLQHNDTIHPRYRQYAQDGMFPLYHMYFGSKWEIDPLLTYRLNSFSMFYLGSTHDYRDFHAADPDRSSRHELTDRVYFMKVQYLFQI